MREDELQALVLELARMLGWRTYHTFDSRRSTVGFPDLVLVRGKRLLFAELKSEKGKTRPEQREWLCALTRAGAEALVWSPADWRSGDIERNLLRH